MQNNTFATPVSHQMQQHKKANCFTSIGNALKKYNPCLRPERQSQNLSKFLQQFKEVSLYDDPYFGEVFLLESITHNQQILLKKQKMSPPEAIERQKQIRELQSFKNNPNLVSQILIQKINKTGFLWTNVEMYIAYDFIVFDLQKQFEYRLGKSTPFTQRQIISIIRGASKGYIHLQPTNYSSIRMKNIYFTRKGQIKIAHPNLFHYKSNLRLICEHDQSKGIYLSPQQMYCLQKGEKDAVLGWKSNCYVFGILLLSLMSGQHLDQVYDYSACYIDKVKIQQLLKNCKQSYSEKLVNYVQKLIQQRPEDRLNFRGLLSKASQTVDAGHQVGLQLLNQESRPVQYLPQYGQGISQSIYGTPNTLTGSPNLALQSVPGQNYSGLPSYGNPVQNFNPLTSPNPQLNIYPNSNPQYPSTNPYTNPLSTTTYSRNRQPQHINYLAGLVHPKIGRTGQFYNDTALIDDPSYRYSTNQANNSSRIKGIDQGSIIAQQRLYYQNKNSSYVGDGKVSIGQGIQASTGRPGQGKTYRDGKGMYQNSDGQYYIGEWKKGEMDGYGKLYWNQKKIHYQGQFKSGKFHGRGVQYNGDPRIVGMTQVDDQPDFTFVRMQRNNWYKYQGNFNNDVRQGQGIAYFKSGKWMGNFRDGQPNGHGLFIDNLGKQARGIWRDGVLQV